MAVGRSQFKKFEEGLSENLPSFIDEILKTTQEKKIYSVGFITSDDYYGFYAQYDFINPDNTYNFYTYYGWKNEAHADFLYHPLVDVVENGDHDIDFTINSNEKWEFAQTLLAILAEHIKQIPDKVFTENSYKREDILFFATTNDGIYGDDMLDKSIKMFNSPETVEKYGLADGLSAKLL